MTGPAYVAYVPKDKYLPRCHHHRKVWSGDETTDLDAALDQANTHSNTEHADLVRASIRASATSFTEFKEK